MANGVDNQARSHAVGCQEDRVAVEEPLNHGWLHNVTFDRIELDSGICLPGHSLCNVDLERSLPSQNASQQARKPPSAQVTWTGTDEPRTVRSVDSLRIDDNNVSDAETGEVLVDKRASASGSHDTDLLSGEDVLTAVAEQAHLPVVSGVGTGWLPRCGIEDLLRLSDNDSAVKFHALAGRYPDVACHSLTSKHERSNERTIKNVEKSRVAPTMRRHVIVGEGDPMDVWVIVDGEVGEPFVGAGQSTASDEVGRKHAVATLARHIVDSIGGEKQPAAQQVAPAGSLDDGSPDDSPMLVLVGLEEVLLEVCPHP